MQIVGLKNCDKCRAARKALADTATFRDISIDPPTQQEIAQWAQAAGVDVLINKKSTTWRGLSEEERASDPIKLAMRHPKLIKRPVIITSNRIFVGWDRDVQAAIV